MIIYLCQKRAVKWLCYSLFIFVGGCPDFEITRPQSETDSVALFATHLHPLIKKYQCGNCHVPGVGQDTTSDFAIDKVKEAHDLMLDEKVGALVDLDNPSGSELVQRGPLRSPPHNCPAGVTCDIVANNFIGAIEKWRKGLGDARAKLIQTHSLDITAVTTKETTIWYDLRHLVQGGMRQQPPNNTGAGTNQILPPNNQGPGTNQIPPPNNIGPGNNFMQQQPPTQQFPQIPQQIFAGLGNCPQNITICLEVVIHKDSSNSAYFIDRFEIKTNSDIYVKNGSSLLNGQASNNFSSADCVVQQQDGFNFLKFSNVPITDQNARQQMLAFRFKQLRLATENDVNYCTEKKQTETGPLSPTALITKYCTGSCHTGPGGGRTAINPNDQSPANKRRLLGGITDRDMPQGPLRTRWINNERERNCLTNWLENQEPPNC